ncbi:MAG: hypothetical protein ACFFDW_06625 [Candidatus Thorarchaeota archaeon]
MKKFSPRIVALALLVLTFLTAGGIAVHEGIAPPSGGISPGDDGTGGGGS